MYGIMRIGSPRSQTADGSSPCLKLCGLYDQYNGNIDVVMDLVCLLDPEIYDSRSVLCLLTTHKLKWLMGGAWTHMGQDEPDLTKSSSAYVKGIRLLIYSTFFANKIGMHGRKNKRR